jgi:UDP-N-acetyl-D-mannosaminuronate dehydrogenase
MFLLDGVATGRELPCTTHGETTLAPAPIAMALESPAAMSSFTSPRSIETIIKVVAGQDDKTSRIIADVYGSVVKAGIHCAPSIKVAEAAKVIENTQRDLNIAFMNELSAVLERLGAVIRGGA